MRHHVDGSVLGRGMELWGIEDIDTKLNYGKKSSGWGYWQGIFTNIILRFSMLISGEMGGSE